MLPILYAKHPKLCLHTPRADCNVWVKSEWTMGDFFASTRPVQIATQARPA